VAGAGGRRAIPARPAVTRLLSQGPRQITRDGPAPAAARMRPGPVTLAARWLRDALPVPGQGAPDDAAGTLSGPRPNGSE
jgi:hypothetical protein